MNEVFEEAEHHGREAHTSPKVSRTSSIAWMSSISKTRIDKEVDPR